MLPYSEFVPMLWGDGPDKIAGFNQAAKDFASNGVKAVLSFDEPNGAHDAGGGSSISPANAAKVHIDVFNELEGVEIGAPGTTQGADAWWEVCRRRVPPRLFVVGAQAYESTLQEWTAECEKLGGCNFDFVPFHWYGLDAKVFAKDLVC